MKKWDEEVEPTNKSPGWGKRQLHGYGMSLESGKCSGNRDSGCTAPWIHSMPKGVHLREFRYFFFYRNALSSQSSPWTTRARPAEGDTLQSHLPRQWGSQMSVKGAELLGRGVNPLVLPAYKGDVTLGCSWWAPKTYPIGLLVGCMSVASFMEGHSMFFPTSAFWPTPYVTLFTNNTLFNSLSHQQGM